MRFHPASIVSLAALPTFLAALPSASAQQDAYTHRSLDAKAAKASSAKDHDSCYKQIIGQGKYMSQGSGSSFDTTISCISCGDLPAASECDEQSGGTGIRCQYSETSPGTYTGADVGDCNYLGYFGIDKIKDLDGKCSFGYGEKVESLSEAHKEGDDDAMIVLFGKGENCRDKDGTSFRLKGYYDSDIASTVLHFTNDEGKTIYTANEPRITAAFKNVGL